MADRKISELSNITGVNLNDADEFVVVDTSADETKALTFGELKAGLDTGSGFVRITGDTMTGALTTTLLTVPTAYGGSGAAHTFTLQSTSGNSNHSKILIGNSIASDNGGISFYSAGASVATERMRISGTSGAVTINDGSENDADFRVESDTNANAFLVDASASKAMFNTNYNADGGVVTIRGTYGAYNASDFRGNNALVLSGADPGSAASGSGVNLALVPISNRGATAVISGENTSTNKEGGARLRFSTGGSTFPTTLKENMMLNHNSGAIFNDGGADLDFRVESDGNANMLFVDAGNNAVNVGTSSANNGVLNVSKAGNVIQTWERSNKTSNTGYGSLNIETNSQFTLAYDSVGGLIIGSSTDPTTQANFHNDLRLIASEIVVNEDGRDKNFRVESDSKSHMLFIDASTDRIGINESSPDAFLDISGNGATTSKMFEISTGGVAGGPSSTFYGGYVQVQANNNAPDSYGWYVTNEHAGISNPTTGIYGLATMTSSNRRSIGIYGSSSVNSAAVHNPPANASAAVAAGVYAEADVSGTTNNSTNAALIAYNQSSYGNTAYGAYIRADNGPTNVKPLLVDYAGNNIFEVDAADGITVNESSRDYIDFRVESDGATHMLFVDASRNSVGINSSNPDSGRYLHIEGGGTGIGLTLKDTAGTQFGIFNDANNLTFRNDSGSFNPLSITNSSAFNLIRNGAFAGTDSLPLNMWHYNDTGNPTGQILVGGTTNYTGDMVFKVRAGGTSGAGGAAIHEYMRIRGNERELVVNQDGLNHDFRVESDSNVNMFKIDGEMSKAAFGATPQTAWGGTVHTNSLSVGASNHTGYNVYSSHEGNVASSTTVNVMEFEGPAFARYMTYTISGYLCQQEGYFEGYQNWGSMAGTVGSTLDGTITFNNGSNSTATKAKIQLELINTSGTSGYPKYRMKLITGTLSGQLYDTTVTVKFYNPVAYQAYV